MAYDNTATVSGSVATFFNGSDEVPCKSLNVSLPASLEGYESIDVHRNGKNLIDITTLVDGYVNNNGTFNPNHTMDDMRSGFIRVKPSTRYTFRIIKTTGTYTAQVNIGLYAEPNVESFISKVGQDFTTTAATNYVVVSARNLKTATQIQLEQGDKNTGYEEFEDTKWTIPLGRTIYGGTVDVVNGTGTDENGNNFTFTGQDVSTRLLANSFYVDLEGSYNMDMTYYLNGFGYPAVTVNRAMGKNLFKFLCYYGGAYNPSVGAQWTMKVNTAQWNDNGDGSFWLKPAGNYYVYTFLIPVRHGVEYNLSFLFTSEGAGQVTCGFLDRSYTVMSVERITTVPINFNRNIDPPQGAGFYYLVFNNANTSNVKITVTNPQMEFGRSKTEYEPYVEPVSQTVKFHKIIYGGEVDVIKGTAKPKNLVPPINYKSSYFSVADDGTVSQITAGASFAWSYSNSIFKVTLPVGTYTAIEELLTDSTSASHGVQVFNSSDNMIGRVSSGAKTAGTYSATFTLTEETEVGIVCKLYDGTAKLYIVSGSSASEYTPYFEPFNFTPVNFNTVEGENTLYASEGDSVITYRKETD